MHLRPLGPELYARDVLPLTAPLWAGRRTFDTYVAQTLEIARSRYGHRHYRTIGLYDGITLVASCKQYARSLHSRFGRLSALGFGAVFTPAAYRGRGYASIMMALALDRARADGHDLAYLFSDIRPQFYAALGFATLPSRALTLHASALPSQRLDLATLAEGGWNAVRRCFEAGERERSAGFVRTPLAWEWIRMRVGHDSEHIVGDATNLVARRKRRIAAYVLGVRAPERDAYIVDEYGFADDDAARLVPPLLRAAAGDLRRVIGWLPPAGARELLPKGTLKPRKSATLMAAPLSARGKRLTVEIERETTADFCWSTEHI